MDRPHKKQKVQLYLLPDKTPMATLEIVAKHPTCGHALDGEFHYLRRAMQQVGTGWRSTLIKCPHCTEENGRLRRVRLSAQGLEQLFPDANVPDYAKGWTFDNFPEHLDDIAVAAIQSTLEDSLSLLKNGDTGISLFIHGATGSGKTSAAVSCLHRYTQEGYRCLFLSARRYIRLLQSHQPESAHREELVLSVPVLIFDDLGSEIPTDWALGKIFDVIEERGANGLVTIITSNNDLSALRKFWFKTQDAEVQQQSGRIIRRLAERFRVIPMAGGE
jgi:DNA replication protein DnaC